MSAVGPLPTGATSAPTAASLACLYGLNEGLLHSILHLLFLLDLTLALRVIRVAGFLHTEPP